jgi:hypothetical protein
MPDSITNQVNVDTEPEVGKLSIPIDLKYIGGNGKLVFVSKSKPFTKDGKQFVRIARAYNPLRAAKKKLMSEEGLTGKQLMKMVKKQRMITKKSVDNTNFNIL